MKVKTKKKRAKIVIILILAIIVLCGILVGRFLASRFSNINFKEIDKDQLAVNDDLYNQISDSISADEYRNIKTFVLFGIDTESIGDGQSEENFAGRTDAIIITSINTQKKTLKMISIPRDTYVDIEGYGKNKINHAHVFGEEQLSVKTINQNFGLNITDYVTIDFSGLINVIDDIGGIELTITQQEKNYINERAKFIYRAHNKKTKTLTSYGTVTLDGTQALTHSRNRTVGDDFTRAGRQREVLEAIVNKMSKMDASEIINFAEVFLNEVTTNINITEYMGTLSDILLNKSTYLNSIVSGQVPTREYAKDQYIDGIYYFVPDEHEMLKEKMLEYLYKT